MRRRPQRTPQDADESYQVDAIVSLFAVMLIVLISLVTATATQQEPVITNYQTRDPARVDMPLRSFQLTYRNREHWAVFADGALARFDLGGIVDRLASKDQTRAEIVEDRFVVSYTADSAEVSAYTIAVTIYEFSADDWIYDTVLDMGDDNAMSGWREADSSVVLYPERGAAARVPRLSEALATGDRRGHFVFTRRDSGVTMRIRRNSLNFQLETMFRD